MKKKLLEQGTQPKKLSIISLMPFTGRFWSSCQQLLQIYKPKYQYEYNLKTNKAKNPFVWWGRKFNYMYKA